mmetsp:Transcript_128370/g.222560  ORF Transcript_128370/g.222560 Transcript_128370/m.222560 type:complete len:215 (-) Transcript_128370:1282-1926(-)
MLTVHFCQLHQRVDLVLGGLESLVNNCLQGLLKLADSIVPTLQPDIQLGKILAQLLLVWVTSQRIIVVLNGFLIVMGLHSCLANLLHQSWVSLAFVDVHCLLEGFDCVGRLLDREQSIPKDQVVLDSWLVVNNGLVTKCILFLVLSVLDVNVRHRRFGNSKLRMVRLHCFQHVDCMIHFTLLDRQLAVCHQDLHLLGGASELSNGVFDCLGCLV